MAKGKEIYKKDEVATILEDIQEKFEIIAEGHKSLVERLDTFKNDTHSNFKSLADYLARIEAEIHGEIKSKVSIKDFGTLEKRVEQLEKMMKIKHFARA